MCSTPQKHPAAIVAFCAPSGRAMLVEPPDSGVKRIVVDEKGRVRRCSIDAMVGMVMIVKRKRRNLVRGFRLDVFRPREDKEVRYKG